MTQSPVNFSEGLPETVLVGEDPALIERLEIATQSADAFGEVANVVKSQPTFLLGWARLSELAQSDIEGYAYARVGYHRGLDALRKAGWRGSGYVKGHHQENHGFLRCVELLAAKAEAIGEGDEAKRCKHFLYQLDPQWGGLPA